MLQSQKPRHVPGSPWSVLEGTDQLEPVWKLAKVRDKCLKNE
jgi:hypothetical protein